MSIPVSMQNSTIQSFVSKGSVKSMAAVGSNPLKASIAEKQRKMEEIKEAYQKRTLQPSPKKPNKTIAKKRSQERDDYQSHRGQKPKAKEVVTIQLGAVP